MAFNGTKITEYKNGRDAATGTPALGTTFNNEFDRLYENDNHLNDTKLDKAGGSITGNLEVQGNLTVQGDTVQINVTEVNAEDKVVTLNYGETGPGVSGDGLSGIEVDRGSGQDKARLVYDEADDEWKSGLGSALLPLLRILAGNKAALDELIEKTLDHGIIIDGVQLKDGTVIQSNKITVTTATQQMENNKEYLVNYSGGRCTLTLPATSSVGDTIKIRDIGVYGWKIAQNAGQNILLQNGKSTVPGITGDVHSRIGGAAVELMCVAANMTWKIMNLQDEWLMKGYYMGGYTTAVVNAIESLSFYFETCNLISAVLSTAKQYGTGVSGNSKGYYMGGSTLTTAIEAMNFSNDTCGLLSATLDTAKYEGAGVNGNLKGYCMGGQLVSSGYTNVIEDMHFANETSTVVTATINTARYGGPGVSGSLKGYQMGGYSNQNHAVIDDLNFSVETSDAISAVLNTAKSLAAGISGIFKGYILGGYTSTAVIEGLAFITEAVNVLSETLNTAKQDLVGISGMLKGYVMGGVSLTAVIEDLTYSTETSNVISATLSAAKRNATSVQGFIG
ncbi:MAG: hypothetical protein JW864_11930 [Spirochaetes bacterium]|nr:hypothetical protein [Spirochaetota bacterium]